MTTNIAKDGGLTLVINFSAGVIVSEFDELIMKTGRVQKIREYFDELMDTVEGKDGVPEEVKLERRRQQVLYEESQRKYQENKETQEEKNLRLKDEQFDPIKIDRYFESIGQPRFKATRSF